MMLLARNQAGDRERAMRVLDETLELAQQLGMQDLIRRVLALQELQNDTDRAGWVGRRASSRDQTPACAAAAQPFNAPLTGAISSLLVIAPSPFAPASLTPSGAHHNQH
jgi:hypothetical protein